MSRKLGNYIKEGLSALVVSVILSLILVLVCAMVVKLFSLDPKIITVFNTVIKVLSILLAVLICFKTPHNGWIRGIIVGVAFVLMSHVLFGVISSNLSFHFGFIADVLLGAVSGFVSGILAISVRKKNV